MAEANSPLLEIALDDIPLEFIRGLVEKKPLIYREAHSHSYDDPAWDGPEAEYILGHHRRILFEKNFRQEALNCGLAVDVKRNSAGNTPYTLIRTGRLLLTASY